MKYCPNCLNPEARLMYQQNNTIVYQNVLLQTYEDALKTPRAELQLYYCDACSFLFNASFDAGLLSYDNNYENAQNHSAFFDNYLNERAEKILLNHETYAKKILEIGCGNGYFLKKIINSHTKNFGYGFDKSLPNKLSDGQLNLINEYYDKNHEGEFDVIISRHVVEHIQDNYEIFKLIGEKNPHAKYFIETPSLEWIIKNKAFFDIFYEHCSYFSAYALEQLLSRLTINLSHVEFAFGGQYLWLEATGGNGEYRYNQKKLSLTNIADFFENFKNHILFYQNLITKEFLGKKILVWGAGAKGVTFANLIDPANQYISYVVDVNPKKQGCFLPGSGHAIFGKDKVLTEGADVVFIMNPNYKTEIENSMQGRVKQFWLV